MTRSSSPRPTMIVPASSSVRMVRITTSRASSTCWTRTGPNSSISSLRFSAARVERFAVILTRTSSVAPLRAMATIFEGHVSHDVLYRAVIEVDDVGELEQMPTNLLAQLGDELVERGQHGVLGGGFGPVEHVHEWLHAAGSGGVTAPVPGGEALASWASTTLTT